MMNDEKRLEYARLQVSAHVGGDEANWSRTSSAAALAAIEARHREHDEARSFAVQGGLARLEPGDTKGRLAELTRQDVDVVDGATAAKWAKVDALDFAQLTTERARQEAAETMAANLSARYAAALREASPEVADVVRAAGKTAQAEIGAKEERKAPAVDAPSEIGERGAQRPGHTLDATERAALEALKAVLRERGDSERTVDAVEARVVERFQSLRERGDGRAGAAMPKHEPRDRACELSQDHG